MHISRETHTHLCMKLSLQQFNLHTGFFQSTPFQHYSPSPQPPWGLEKAMITPNDSPPPQQPPTMPPTCTPHPHKHPFPRTTHEDTSKYTLKKSNQSQNTLKTP